MSSIVSKTNMLVWIADSETDMMKVVNQQTFAITYNRTHYPFLMDNISVLVLPKKYHFILYHTCYNIQLNLPYKIHFLNSKVFISFNF